MPDDSGCGAGATHPVSPGSIDREIYRNAVIKGFELSLETSGKLLRRALKAYYANPAAVDEMTYKDVFRHATKHRLLSPDQVERWFTYRDHRNLTAHDYGESLADATLQILPHFIADAQALAATLETSSHG